MKDDSRVSVAEGERLESGEGSTNSPVNEKMYEMIEADERESDGRCE